MKSNSDIVCRKCKYYFVTWEPGQPHGCRAMNFKCRRLPSVVVRASSGCDCLQYTPKKRSPATGPESAE